MITSGMDLAAVRQLVVHLEREAEALQSGIGRVESMISRSTWVGADSEDFRGAGWPSARQSLQVAVQGVHELARIVQQNADAQERASTEGGGPGHGPAAGGAPGSGGAAPAGGGPLSGAALAHATAVVAGLLADGRISADDAPAILAALGAPGAAAALAKVQSLVALIQDPQIRGQVEGAFQRTLAEWGTSGGGTVLGGLGYTYDVRASAEVRAGGSAGYTLDSNGLALQAEGSIGLFAQADAGATFGTETVGGAANAHVAAGLGASGSAGATFGPDGVTANASVQAGAYVEASLDASVHLAGIEAGAEVTGYAGVMVVAEAEGSIGWDKIEGRVELGAALGVGGGISFDVNVSPADVAAHLDPRTWDVPDIDLPDIDLPDIDLPDVGWPFNRD